MQAFKSSTDTSWTRDHSLKTGHIRLLALESYTQQVSSI